jgi:hypothetical protein
VRKQLARVLRWIANKIDAPETETRHELCPSEFWHMRELALGPLSTPIDFEDQWNIVTEKYGYPLPDDEDYRHGIYL